MKKKVLCQNQLEIHFYNEKLTFLHVKSQFSNFQEYKTGQIQLTLFEFDDRFGLKFPTEFVHYDYKHPTDLPAELLAKFDVIIADPPFLAAECLIKTAHSIRLLGKSDVKVLLCTGAIMEDYVSANLRKNAQNDFSKMSQKSDKFPHFQKISDCKNVEKKL